MKAKSWWWTAVAGAALVLVAGAVGKPSAGFDLHRLWPGRPGVEAAQVAPERASPPLAGAPSPVPLVPGSAPNYRAIVEQYGPAVVGVTVEGVRHSGLNSDDGEADEGAAGAPFGQEDPFFRFFRGLPGFGGRMAPPADQPFRGQGSGFIIGSDGLILTNAHVVRDAKEVTVKLTDRREYRAKVMGADPDTDIAVLRIDASALPTVKLGDPKAIHVGDYVLAIGSPFGFEQSATQGIVSAKGRALPGDAYVPFIQTDAAVNPGNSGGPLFDASGAVIGINAQIYSRTGGYQGLAFAIPIDVALKVKDQILKTGKASHARLGVQIQDLSQGLAESFHLARPDGALIASVAPDSAAASAGLKAGDVVLKIDGEPVTQASDLSTRVGMAAPGDKVKLTVWRDGRQRELDVKLGGSHESRVEQQAEADSGNEKAQLGLVLRPLAGLERQQSGIDQGLVVEQVRGAAARAGLMPGDVILAVNGQAVKDVAPLRSALSGKPKAIALLIQRGADRIFVPVTLG